MTAQYELTLQDLQHYVVLFQDHPNRYIGTCHSTCFCLGASTLNHKYPGDLPFEIIDPQNTSALTYRDCHLERADFGPEVSETLCEFDSIVEYTDDSPDYKVTYTQLKDAAGSGNYPHLAQLFSSSSPSLSQE